VRVAASLKRSEASQTGADGQLCFNSLYTAGRHLCLTGVVEIKTFQHLAPCMLPYRLHSMLLLHDRELTGPDPACQRCSGRSSIS